jgi:MSHA pilin protein MshA
VALPKFVDLSSDAKTAAIQGAAGALSSYAAINYAAYQANTAKGVRLSATNPAAALTGSMATWDAKFAIATDGNCAAAAAGVAVSVTLSHTQNSASTATATIICTG